MPYLDKTGLSHFWSNLKTLLDGKAPTSHNHSASQVTSGTLSVSRGGTGKSTITANNFLVGNGTSAMTEVAPSAVPAAIGISDYIVAEGTSGIWTWRKWNSGKAECWCIKTYSATSLTTWGNNYQTTDGALAPVAYPFTFTAEPVCTFTNINTSFGGWACTDTTQTTVDRKAYAPTVLVIRPSNSGSGQLTPVIHYYAIGKWK